MNKIKYRLQSMINTTNWDGIRCSMKGDPSIREISDALKRQREIERECRTDDSSLSAPKAKKWPQ